MKKKTLHLKAVVACLLLTASIGKSFGQQVTSATALNLVKKNSVGLGLSNVDVQNLRVSSAYVDKASKATLVYVQQTYKGVDVFNSIQTYAFKNNALVSATGGRVNNISKLINVKNAKATVTAANAVRAAASHLQLAAPSLANPKQLRGAQELDFGKLDIAAGNVRSNLIWLTDENASNAVLTWQVEIQPKTSSDYWLVNVDAVKGVVISKINLNVNCKWDAPAGQLQNAAVATAVAATDIPEDVQAINSAKYRVIPYPAESPSHPGGTPVVKTNPWTLSGTGNDAVTLKWNDDGTTSFDSTRGNNVLAQEDQNGNNGLGKGGKSTTAVPNLTFNYPPNFNQEPTVAKNQQFALTNLFYWNNIVHDVSYQYGFDEVSGNFQANNLGRGGSGNDYVFADGQDGSGTNNANFATPKDGTSPRMQMFLWSGVPVTKIIKPTSIAGVKASTESAFSTKNKLKAVGPVQNRVVLYADDAANTLHEACNAAVNPAQLAGKIALIDRGTCGFTVKVKNAQTAGAIAAIVVDNIPGEYPITMGGTDNTITIPAVMISFETGDTIKTTLQTQAVTANLAGGVQIDGDLDNGVISHEYTHGISNRLTGGPNNVACLQNKEQMGEGWSDYMALMVTTDWSTAQLTDSMKLRPIGTYVVGQQTTGSGIRYYPYTSDISANPWTYDSMKVSNRFSNGLLTYDSHVVGEVWCNMLWVMTWNIAKQIGGLNANLFNASANGGNNVALQLVIEGMKLQGCSPGFVSGRDGILKADTLLYGGAYSAAIWKSFASRGLGYSAKQNGNNNIKDGEAAYDLPPAPIVKSVPVAEAATIESIGVTKVSPNPARNRTTVTVNGNKKPLTVTLVSSSGKQLRTYNMPGELLQINLPKLASGVYYIKITGEGFAETKKLVIQ